MNFIEELRLYFTPTSRRTWRAIQVTSSLPDAENGDSISTVGSTLASSQNNSICLTSIKVATVPVFAIFSSLSIPIAIVLTHSELQHDDISLEQKILTPLLPYVLVVFLRTWLLWNSVGHRMNGKTDDDITPENDHYQDDSLHVILALLANSSSFTNALLVGFLALSKAPPAVSLGSGILLGTLNYTTDLITEIPDAFRKHVETHHSREQFVKPFFKQTLIAKTLTPHLAYLGLVLREGLPVISGLIRTQATIQVLDAGLQHPLPTPVKIPIALIIYWSTAYLAQFELVQSRDNMHASGCNLEIKNYLSQSPQPLLRITGKITSGLILPELLKICKLSLRSRVNMTLSFATIGLISLLYKALQQYVSSTHTAAVESGQEGLMMGYLLGKNTAIRTAPKLELGIACVAVTLGVIGTFAKSATLHKRAKELVNTQSLQIAIIEDIPPVPGNI